MALINPMVFMAVKQQENQTLILLKSPMDGQEKKLIVKHGIDVMNDALDAYDSGAQVQNAFPFLSAEERDFMMTGVLPEDSDAFYKELDEPNEED